jgi:hypothetical protein
MVQRMDSLMHIFKYVNFFNSSLFTGWPW